MACGTHREWPPPWPVDVDAAEGIGLLVRHLKLSERQYKGLVGVAEDLLDDPAFQRLMDLIDRGLARSPILDAESVRLLCEALDVPEPDWKERLYELLWRHPAPIRR